MLKNQNSKKNCAQTIRLPYLGAPAVARNMCLNIHISAIVLVLSGTILIAKSQLGNDRVRSSVNNHQSLAHDLDQSESKKIKKTNTMTWI
jgi:hypothetical protein